MGVLVLLTGVATTAIIQLSGDADYQYQPKNDLVVNDITGLNPIHVNQVIRPEKTQQIIQAIQDSTGPISIGGGRYSMGGQIAYKDSLHIDMRSFNKVIAFDEKEKTITVQPGITWRDIQEYIDPYNLSVRIMQTYANFTVGGSLSVNVHGRYIGEGPLIKSVLELKVVLANGDEVTATPTINPEIFNGVIGGYGGLGVITQATLGLTDNVKVERQTSLIKASEYQEYFTKNIEGNQDVVFHNGDLYPPNYDEVLNVTWVKSDKNLTIEDRLIKRDDDYKWGPLAAEFVADYDIGKSIRKNIIDPVYYSFDRVVWRNWEASYDVRELEPSNRKYQTYVLREYFIPVENFDQFVPVMKDIFNRNQANIINVSIRHAKAAPENLLSWARKDVFAFVVYYQQGTDNKSKEKVKKWSVEMIDAVIAAGGTYYLPYQIYATAEQFEKAYPRASEFFKLKAKLDPDNRFTNQLWKKYYPNEADTFASNLSKRKKAIKDYYRNEAQTVLTIPEWYLVFNPLEYAEFLESGQNPSNFPFLASLNEYWTLYDRVVTISQTMGEENGEYMTMLKVIGISTTIEYMYKSLYENTIGRFTLWTANGQYTPEDKIIAQAQRAYSNLIFDEAWYMFNFNEWVERIWQETDFWGEHAMRKIERKLFFTLEFGFKSWYANLIKNAAEATYEKSDGLIYLVTSLPEKTMNQLPENVVVIYRGSDNVILSVPRWGEFTKNIPKLLEQGIQISEISGNKEIAVSFIGSIEAKERLSIGKLLFDSKIVSKPGMIRQVMLVDVSRLNEFLKELENRGFALEHLFDY
ncbi:hypothetical protein JCM30760_07550 [Thiomicrorhabdus hydrogeniphila]